MGTAEPNTDLRHRADFRMLRVLAALGLSGIVFVLAAGVDVLTGFPTNSHWSIMVPGFFLAIVLLCLCAHGSTARVFARHPKGLSEKSRLLRCSEGLWAPCIVLLFLAGVLCFLAKMGLAYNEGVTDEKPLLEQRAVYVLNSHGKLTVVSRAKYVTVGILEQAVYSILCLGANLVGLHKVAFGKWPSLPKDNREKEQKEEKASQ